MSINKLSNIAGNLTMGKDCRIDAYVTITGDVTIGDNVHIGVGVCIFGGGGVTIGDMVSLSPGCKIFTATEDANSGMLSNPTLKHRYAKTAPVVIGHRSVIGANSIILPGVTIPDDTQVGALSLVNQSIPAGIHAGIPTRRLRNKPPLRKPC